MSAEPLPHSCKACLNKLTLHHEPNLQERNCTYCDSVVWPAARAKNELLRSIGDFDLIRPVEWPSAGTVFEARRGDSKFLLTLINRNQGETGLYAAVKRFRENGNHAPYGCSGSILHENVLQCDPITWVGDVAIATVEYLDGKTVDEWLDQIDSFTINDAVTIIVALLEASIGLGDVKSASPYEPSKIHITRDGRIKLTDFAGPVFRLFEPPAKERHLRRMASMQNQSRQRMIPRGLCQPPECSATRYEQTTAERQRSHIFRLGALLRELICGHGVPMLSIGLDQIRRLDLIPVHEINTQAPPELSRVIDRMIAFQPSDRYSNYADALSALKALGIHRHRVEFDSLAAVEPPVSPTDEHAWPKVDSQFDFRRMNWGMTPEAIRESESTKPMASMPAFIQYESHFGEHTYLIMYQFADLDGQAKCIAANIQEANNLMVKKAGTREAIPKLAGLGLMAFAEPDEVYSRLIDVMTNQFGEPSVVDGAVHDDPEYLRLMKEESPDDDFLDCKGTYWNCGDTFANVQIVPAPMQHRTIMARLGSVKLSQQQFDLHSTD